MQTAPSRLCIPLTGDIDHHRATLLRRQIDEAVLTARPDILELDFRDVSFMDSSGIGLIMGRYRLVSGWNGRLIVSHMSPTVEKLMQLAGLGVLPIFEENEKEGATHETDQ